MTVGDFFADVTGKALVKSLDAAGVRHRVIADNIANVETPGYTRSKVIFQDKLKTALESGDHQRSKQVDDVHPEVELDDESPARPDGNNVSIDREMAEMAKNSLEYEALVQLLNMRNAMVQTAINEGRR